MNKPVSTSSVLTEEQRQQFVTEGYLVIENAFDGEDSTAWVRAECARVGFDLDNPETWSKEYDRIPTERRVTLTEYAPAAWLASCELMGGEERVAYQSGINLFAVNLRQGADKPWQPASAEAQGWHIDGWNFRHFLDSPDQALLGIPLMTDVYPQGGATFIAADSVPVIARYLAAHPEGVVDYQMPMPELIGQCKDFREVTGKAGDFYLLHPFMLHATSQNMLKRPRAICNVCYGLKAPMNFNPLSTDEGRDGGCSPVEQAILHGLGVDRYPFAPTAERYRTPDGGPINPAWR